MSGGDVKRGPQLPEYPCPHCNASGWRRPVDRGDELRLRREALGLSLRDIAPWTGYTINKLHRLEAGKIQGTKTRRRALAKVGAVLDELEGGPA